MMILLRANTDDDAKTHLLTSFTTPDMATFKTEAVLDECHSWYH